MMLYDHCLQRPDTFDLNVHAPLGRGLLLGGFGRFPGTTHYHDSSLYGNSGTLTNMTTASAWVWSSELGRWLTWYDSTVDVQRTVIPSMTLVAGSTISCWLNIHTLHSTYNTFLGDPSNSTSVIGYHGSSGWWIRAGGTTSSYVAYTASVDTWYHVCWRHLSASLWDLYLNGSYLGQADRNNFTLTAIGNGYSNASYGIRGGYVGDVMVYDRVLSVSEICQLADPSNVMLSGLILPPTRRFWPVAVSGEETPDLLLPHHGMMAM